MEKENKKLWIFQKKYARYSNRDICQEIIKIFEDECPLNKEQIGWLRFYCEENRFPFQAYRWEESKEKTNIFQRLAMPFVFGIMLFMMIFISPIKWFITGEYYFDTKNKFINWLYKLVIWAFGEL